MEPATACAGRLFGDAIAQLPLNITWVDPPAAGLPIEARTVAVDLSTLEPGRYRLTLTMAVRGLPVATGQREIEIIRRR
jgi:hypothetical protein